MKLVKQTNTHNTTRANGRKILYIVEHFTAGTSSKAGSAANVATWFKNPRNKSGSADYIADDATVVQYNPDPKNRFTWAVGGNRYANSKGGSLYGKVSNRNSISVEICSTSPTGKVLGGNDPGWFFTDAVLETALELTKSLMAQYDIDADHVVRHYDVTGKLCPGIVGWNADSGDESAWQAFKARLSGADARPSDSATEELQAERTIWAFFRGKGLNNFATAGIMGNLYAESRLNPKNLQDSEEARIGLSDAAYTAALDEGRYQHFALDGAGYGLAQWTYWSRKRDLFEYSRAEGKSIGNLSMQLEFLWQELEKDYAPLLANLAKSTTVQSASDAFLLQYERPANQSAEVRRIRASFGQGYYNKYAASAAAVPPSTPSATSTSPAPSTSAASSAASNSSTASNAVPFRVRITSKELNVRKKPSAKSDSKIVKTLQGGAGVYTIVEVSGEWGKLKSGLGWMNLRYTERVK